MEPPVLWDQCATSCQPWIPGPRLPKWSSSKTIYFRCRDVRDNSCTGVIVDLQLPHLGQSPQNRSFLSTMEAVTVHCNRKKVFRSGFTYVLWGTLCPVWHAEDGSWHVQLPADTVNSGAARVLADRQIDTHVAALEVCAGGMGGWSTALRCFPQWRVNVAVDNDEDMLSNFALNHDFRLMRVSSFVQEPDSDGPIALLADVMDSEWLSVTLHNDAEVWMVSFPCQSWSSMGHGSGSNSDNGRVLLRVIQCARIVQPLYLLMENVAGFRQHPEYQHFCKAMEEAGFVLAASVVHDLAKVSYTTRRRWLAVFINTLRVEDWPCLGRLMPALCYDEEMYDPQRHCVQMLTALQRAALQILPEEMMLLEDQMLLPRWQRQSHLAKTDALALRVVSRGALFPVLNASYRSAVNFPRDYLGEKGLMSWLVRDHRNQLRWLCKWEASRALGFHASTILPTDEATAFHALGNCISPLHAAFAIHHCSEVMKQQAARPYMATFSQHVRQIKGLRADLLQQYPAMYGTNHEQLQFPGPLPEVNILCPYCGWKTSQPLVIACPHCHLVACVNCCTQTCHPNHLQTRVARPEPSLNPVDDLEGAQFSVKHQFLGDPVQLQVATCLDMSQVRNVLALPAHATFFLDLAAVQDSHRPRHNEAFMYVLLPQAQQVCSLCEDDHFGMLRFCPRCRRLGCNSCVADSCQVCAKGQIICRECHQQIIQQVQNEQHEEAALRCEDQINATRAGFDWAVRCPLEAQTRTITVLLYPDVVVSAPLHRYADTNHILHLLSCTPGAQGRMPQQPVFFWGTSRDPSMQQAAQSGLIVVSASDIAQGQVPVLFKNQDALKIVLLQPPVLPQTCFAAMLSQQEVQEGCQLLWEGQVIQGHQALHILPGQLIVKALPWTARKRQCGYEDARETRLHSDVPASQRLRTALTPTPAATLPDTLPFQVQSTVLGLEGQLLQTPPLRPGSSWHQWLQDLPGLPPLRDLWATINGRVVPPQQPLPDVPFVLRLRYRLRGGTKGKDTLLRKLQDHLQAKGVPQHLSEERAQQALQILGQPAIHAAYQSLDPWAAIKAAAGTKFRLVLPAELKQAKGPKAARSDKSPTAESSEDPWVKGGDPWQQRPPHRHDSVGQHQHSAFALTLLPGHFIEDNGAELPVIQHLAADARGVALLDFDELEAMAQVDILLSPEALAAVVIGTHQPTVGTWPCASITFPAMRQDHKVLFRGFLTNFGKKQATTATAKKTIELQLEDVAIVTVELRQEYILDWATVCRNPLKYVYSVIDGLQNATVSNWSRKFFRGRKEVPKEEAQTWHAFLKVSAAQVQTLLASSGKGGAFLTPKDAESGTTSGHFRVVWLDTLDIEKAIKLQRLYPELLGVVRGKQSLGLRTRASEYSCVRKKLEPSWNPDGVLTDIVVARRWILTPVPPQVDKKAIQHMLQELGWKATPLKQIAVSTWLVGSGAEDPPPLDTFTFAGTPVLVTEQKHKKPALAKEVVLAAPPASKRALEQHFAQRLPVQHILRPQDTTMSQHVPARCLVSELKEEINTKMHELQAQVQQAVNMVSQRVDAVQTQAAASSMETSAVFAQQDQRLSQLESSMQTLTTNVATKVDLAEALRSAMEGQAREIRAMLAKRSPEASPAHEAKAARNA